MRREIGSNDGLPPVWRQAIIYTNACLLLIEPLGTNMSEIESKCDKSLYSYKNLMWKYRLQNGDHSA